MRASIPLLSLVGAVQALYFFLDGNTPRCFFEDLPKGTLVVGHYKAEEYDENTKLWNKHEGLKTYISVEEVFDNDHRVVSQTGAESGRYTFSAAGAGEHRICFQLVAGSGIHGGWLNSGSGKVRFELDMVIGDGSHLEDGDKTKMEDLSQRIKDLNSRLQDIRREQVFQREREAEFRDQSESTNSRVVRWMFIQVVVLGLTCAWQLSHLRSFFIKQKLT